MQSTRTSRSDMSESQKARLRHAQHNEEVSNHLFEKEYWDWVITTAFYSALHYVLSAVFPLKETKNGKAKTYPDFNTYYKEIRRPWYDPGRHKVTSDLVAAHISAIVGEYNALKDAAWAARYNNYHSTRGEAEAALSWLGDIKRAL